MSQVIIETIKPEVFAAVRTYLATARKQGLSMLQAAYLAFTGSPFIPAIPE